MWDSPLTPFGDFELLYTAIFVPIVLAAGALGWRLGRYTGLLSGLAAVFALGPYILHGLWAINGAGVSGPFEDVRCVLTFADIKAPMSNYRDEEHFDCDTSWGKFKIVRSVAIGGAARAVGTPMDLRLRRGRFGWPVAERDTR